MTPEQYGRVKEVFQRAIELEPDQRTAYLDSECGADARLRAEVASLLAVHQAEGTQLVDEPLAELVPDLGDRESPEISGRQIGPYRLERLLGEGGMGAVYEASRADDEFQQRVALKLVRKTERDAIALLGRRSDRSEFEAHLRNYEQAGRAVR
jgi:serine/threonine protein kinase